ncbi:MAG: response regulator [Eubacteriales bacterium]|nr:response regulator [Eubacteriales bacterium]
MLGVMIIDDDLVVRERLKSMIDWEGMCLQLVCEAADSDSAHELYLLHRPKIIITDICIPIISGLELAEEFAKLDPDIRFIVITGFSDFDYACKSVKLGAVNLLSKPIFPETIRESLQKAIAYFEHQKEVFATYAALEAIVSSNMPVLQKSFMEGLLCQKQDDEAHVQKKMAELKIDLPYDRFVVAVVDVETADGKYCGETMRLLLSDAITTLFRESNYHVYSHIDSHGSILCIMNTYREMPDDDIEEHLNQLRDKILYIADCKIRAGIGQTVDRSVLLQQSCAEARVALNYQHVLGGDAILHYKNIKHFENSFPDEDALSAYLVRQFQENNIDELVVAIEKHICSLSAQREESLEKVRDFCTEYLLSIILASLKMGLALDLVEGNGVSLNALIKTEKPSAQVEYVLTATKTLLSLLFGSHDDASNYLISQARDYISRNLRVQDLNLDSVSCHVGLSRIYFCKLFHKEVGVSFNNYLKHMRIEHSKRLLTETNLKVFEISDAAGFSNAKYFCYVFKQEIGMTPLEYQKKHGEKKG